MFQKIFVHGGMLSLDLVTAKLRHCYPSDNDCDAATWRGCWLPCWRRPRAPPGWAWSCRPRPPRAGWSACSPAHPVTWSPGHKETAHLLGHGLQNVGDGFSLVERHFVIRTWGKHLLLLTHFISIVYLQHITGAAADYYYPSLPMCGSTVVTDTWHATPLGLGCNSLILSLIPNIPTNILSICRAHNNPLYFPQTIKFCHCYSWGEQMGIPHKN